MLPITAPYAALLTLLFLILSARIILYRRANALSVGDEGDRRLTQLMRAQANCAEYAPLGIILIALMELNGAPSIALHPMGILLLAGRLAHAAGYSALPQIMPLRVAGTAMTLTMLGLSALAILAHSLT